MRFFVVSCLGWWAALVKQCMSMLVMKCCGTSELYEARLRGSFTRLVHDAGRTLDAAARLSRLPQEQDLTSATSLSASQNGRVARGGSRLGRGCGSKLVDSMHLRSEVRVCCCCCNEQSSHYPTDCEFVLAGVASRSRLKRRIFKSGLLPQFRIQPTGVRKPHVGSKNHTKIGT